MDIRPTKRTARVVMLLLIPLVLFIGFVFVRHLLELRALQADEAALAETLAGIEKETAQLDDQLEYAQTDSFIEQLAREILGWIKPGEHKFEPEASPAPQATPN